MPRVRQSMVMLSWIADVIVAADDDDDNDADSDNGDNGDDSTATSLKDTDVGFRTPSAKDRARCISVS
jgi:hypothetical protein